MIAEHKWPIVSHKVAWPSTILKTKSEAKVSDEIHEKRKIRKAREIYEKYLYHYEKTVNLKTKFKLTDKKHKVKLEDIDPTLLKEVPIFEV